MILTKCAACAAPLENKCFRCGICKTRYCGQACQKLHWKKGGHKAICQEIKRGGGAEQYNADKKYKVFVAVAVEKCAADTKGQTCYICTEAVHWKTREGLVRGCACRGTSGFVHVSCLAEQAKILVAEAFENNLSDKAKNEKWSRWHKCSLCEQQYHGVVYCALGWACWKTNLGRPEMDWSRVAAMGQLGNGLSVAGHDAEALSVQEALLPLHRRLGSRNENVLALQCNLAATYHRLGRKEEALRMQRDVYSERLKLFGEEHPDTLINALSVAISLDSLERLEEAKSLLLKTIPVARRALGESNDITLRLRKMYAKALYKDPAATLDDHREAVTMLEEMERTARRVFGGAHPQAVGIERTLHNARTRLRFRAGPVMTQCDSEAMGA